MNKQTPPPIFENNDNPYQPPKTNIDNNSNETFSEGELASRGQRFLAAMIDGTIGILGAIPLWILTGAFSILMQGKQLPLMMQVGMALYGFFVFIIIHGYTLNKYGQTVGKRLMGIFIANIETNQKATITDILLKRLLPVSLLANVPTVGGLITLIDILMIFRQDKRCGHDLIASTRVLKVPPGY